MILVVFILVLAINAAVFDFLREHFFQNALKFIFFLGAIMHSSVVGIYGLVALSKLNHVRPVSRFFDGTKQFPFIICRIISVLFEDSIYSYFSCWISRIVSSTLDERFKINGTLSDSQNAKLSYVQGLEACPG